MAGGEAWPGGHGRGEAWPGEAWPGGGEAGLI